MIVLAEQSDGTVVPMLVENGQSIKLAGMAKDKFIANKFIAKNMERYYNQNELMKFVTALDYSESDIKGTRGKNRNVSKDDVIAFLHKHWAEWFAEEEEEEEEEEETKPEKKQMASEAEHIELLDRAMNIWASQFDDKKYAAEMLNEYNKYDDFEAKQIFVAKCAEIEKQADGKKAQDAKRKIEAVADRKMRMEQIVGTK